MDEYPFEILIEDLKSSASRIRMHALNLLIKCQDYKQTVPIFIEALKSDFVDIRQRAAIFLGQVGDKSAVPALIESLKDENASVRSYLAISLGNLGDPSAIPELIKALKQDSDIGVRCNCAKSIGNIFDRPVAGFGSEHVRSSESLCAIAIPPLIETLESDNDELRAHSAIALGGVGHPSAILPLIRAMNDKCASVQKHAEEDLEFILDLCETKEKLDQCEEKLDQGFSILKKDCMKRDEILKISSFIAKLKTKISRWKNQDAAIKDIMLTDRPKPPKRSGLYRISKVNCHV